MKHQPRSILSATASALAVAVALFGVVATQVRAEEPLSTKTPIKHVVIIFPENESFDHYFGTYPNAVNNPATDVNPLSGKVSYFYPKANTPTVNGLNPDLLTNNPNTNAAGTAQANPQRMTPSQAYTCSQNHNYQPEQEAVDAGLLDKFPKYTGKTTSEGCLTDGTTVMDYFDGNTVTALWNYAQNFAMSDNHFGTNFGPSTPGAINLISGQTHGATVFTFGAPLLATGIYTATATSAASNPGNVTSSVYQQAAGSDTDFGDQDPYLDDCGKDGGGIVSGAQTMQMSSKNIGDLLNASGLTWGWFNGGFRPTVPAANIGTASFTPAVCGSGHTLHTYNGVQVPNPPDAVPYYTTGWVDIHSTVPATITIPANLEFAAEDYIPHHQPFQYYASTRNPHHLPPTSTAMIGYADQANHQYDTIDFFNALAAGNLPAVSFIKPPAYQDAHPGNSDPLLEQTFLVTTINAIMQSPEWSSTAIIITYDDSDGWYDHVTGPVISQSNTSNDSLTNPTSGGTCGTATAGGYENRCGYGPRIPFLVISPYAKSNYVDSTLIDQTSVIAFVEYNWGLPFLDGATPPTPETNASFDRFAGSILNMFEFPATSGAPNPLPLILVPTSGEPAL